MSGRDFSQSKEGDDETIVVRREFKETSIVDVEWSVGHTKYDRNPDSVRLDLDLRHHWVSFNV